MEEDSEEEWQPVLVLGRTSVEEQHADKEHDVSAQVLMGLREHAAIEAEMFVVADIAYFCERVLALLRFYFLPFALPSFVWFFHLYWLSFCLFPLHLFQIA